MNSDELQELFIDTEANDHNQRNASKESVVKSRTQHYTGDESYRTKIHLDSPLFFDIEDVISFAVGKNTEMIDTGEEYQTGSKKGQPKMTQGSLNGKLTNYISRLENRIRDKRLSFLLGERSKQITFEETLRELIGYSEQNTNVTIIDLSGVPFEVLSITVSLISRILFE